MSSSEGNEGNTPPDAPRPRKRWPIWARIIRAVVIIAIVLILFLFFAAPPIARSVIEKQLAAQLSTKAVPREAHVEKVRINPLNLSVAIEELSVTVPSRNETLVAWRTLYASLDLRTLFTREWRFRKITLDGFTGRIAIQKNNQLNFGDLFESSTTAPTTTAPQNSALPLPPSNPAALRINHLVVTDSHLDYSDDTLPKPFSTQIGPMSFTVTDFQTGGPDRAPGTFAATTETGETLAWKGNLSIAPLYSRGELRLGSLSVKKYAPYYTGYVGFDVLDGLLDITVNYELSSTARVFSMRASQSGLTLRSLKLAPRGTTQPMVTINTLALDQLSVESINDDDPAKSRRTFHIARATLDTGAVAFKRDANGLALVTLFAPPPDTNTTTAATPPPAPPVTTATSSSTTPPVDVILDELNIRNLAVAVEDDTLGQKPLRANLTLATVTAKNFSLNHLDQPMPVAATLQPESGGHLTATGTMTIYPFKGKYTADWANLHLAEGSPYLEQLIPIRVAQGALSGTATVNITPAGDVSATADITIADFAALDATTSTPLQSWKQLTVSGATFATAPKTQLTIAEVALQSPQTQVTIQPAGVLNWTALTGGGTTATTPPQNTTATATTAASGTDSAFLVEIKNVLLTDGRAEFRDQSIKPAVTLALTAITGTISSLSTANLAHARLNLGAKVNDTAPVTLVGRLNALTGERTTSLKFALQGADLAPLAPYIEKYAGRKLAGGALTIDVTTKLNARFLDSANVITLDNFYFGDRVNSPDATTLPVALAASLLRDTKGQIVLDVPVQGSLDDPNFKYGRAVWRAIGNLLVKTATAPFTLLAGIAGAGQKTAATTTANPATANTPAPDQDYSFIEFDPASSTLNPAAQQKLATIAQGLAARPELHLDITGSYDATADKTAPQPPADAPPPPATPITDDQLRQLATARAQAVKNFLTAQGKVPADRVNLLKDTPATGARATLQLN